MGGSLSMKVGDLVRYRKQIFNLEDKRTFIVRWVECSNQWVVVFGNENVIFMDLLEVVSESR